MSTDIEQQLRSEMSQVQVRVPPGLARQAYRRYRTRRLAGRAVAAGGAAVVIGAGTAVAAVATRPAPAVAQQQTAAYVVSHLDSALAATHKVVYTTTRFRTAGHGAPAIQRGWFYGSRLRLLNETANGTKLADTGHSTSRGTVTNVDVYYQSRTWDRWSSPAGRPLPSLCSGRAFIGLGPFGTAADILAALRSSLRCGALRVTGHQVLHGVDAIELTVQSTFKVANLGKPMTQRTFRVTETIWVDPRTYLPIQLVIHIHALEGSTVGLPPLMAAGISHADVRTEFTYLPPTRANRAELIVPIPPGFRHVSV